MPVASEVLKKSVTKLDRIPGQTVPGVSGLTFLSSFNPYSPVKLLPELPAYWTISRDLVLTRTVLAESNWSNAIRIAVSKMASALIELDGPPRNKDRFQEMYLTANLGRGYVNWIAQHGRDYLCTDNGTHDEIIRASGAAGAKILGIVHLDSRRCTRTGDPQYPIVYRDKMGFEHAMKDYQVISLSAYPDPADTYNGVGLCAASSAYHTIRRMALIENYLSEKIGGLKANEIHLVNGATPDQLKDALNLNEQEVTSMGGVSYGGVVLVPYMDETAPGGYRIQIAGLPENFDIEKERQEARLVYADAIGIDPQELMPLSSGPLGTATQSEILDDKESGKGLSMWKAELQYLHNQYILPDNTTFSWSIGKDYRDQKATADIASAYGTAAKTMVDAGVLDAARANNWLVDKGVLDQAYLIQTDVTPDTELTLDEKPLDLLDLLGANAEEPAPVDAGALADLLTGGMSLGNKEFIDRVRNLKQSNMVPDNVLGSILLWRFKPEARPQLLAA